MSKNVSFKRVSEGSCALLNSALDVIFISAAESRRLAADKKRVKAAYEAALLAEAAGETPKESSRDLEKQMNILKDKQKGLNAWRKESLFGSKDTNGNHKDGILEMLGVDTELYSAYVLKVQDNKPAKFQEAVRDCLVKGFGLDLQEQLVKRLASRLADNMGIQLTKGAEVLDGKLVKSMKEKQFMELFTCALAQYAAKTADGRIVIPTADLYSAVVEYDHTLKVENAYTKVADDAIPSADSQGEEAAA